jgi:hypothetical protein
VPPAETSKEPRCVWLWKQICLDQIVAPLPLVSFLLRSCSRHGTRVQGVLHRSELRLPRTSDGQFGDFADGASRGDAGYFSRFHLKHFSSSFGSCWGFSLSPSSRIRSTAGFKFDVPAPALPVTMDNEASPNGNTRRGRTCLVRTV